ncbi:YwaF family protein [Paenibacillus sp. UNC451MF]|uniref:YwaF family protein n=1 Tax=Paenibacillus sp. UNC451MF TaxID=1449063 RepID=UPI00048C0427|nr:TIGR02206 family membrane protein [Paenibacillus sp. UNC451MF]
MLNPYWDPSYAEPFLNYSPSHLIAIAVLCIISTFLYVFRSAIQASARLQSFIRWSLLMALAVPEVLLNVWYVQEGMWDAQKTLPLELCSIMLILSVVMLLTSSRMLYALVFFAGIGGALQAMITPSLWYPFPHFRFFHFFIVHIAIIAAALYMTWIKQYKPNWKAVGWTMVFLNVLLIIVGALNYWLDANYMFLMHKPLTASLLDLLGPHPYYLLSEEAIALFMFSIMYVVFFVLPGKRNRMSKSFISTNDTSSE